MYWLEEKDIIGKTIESVEVREGEDTLTFVLTDGTTARFEVTADCCSSSWIEHVTVPADIKGATITDVKESTPVETANADSDWGEYIQVYNTAFVTPKGEVIVEYRNSSNGYYGGSLVGPYIS